MAKSTSQNKVTAEYWHHWGEEHYRLAIDMEDRDEPQSKIDACWKLAAKDFWEALVLGSNKAPLSLFKCFAQGVGIKKDADIAALMYGTALKLTPQDCATKIKPENKPVIAQSMQPRIDALVKLVKQTHDNIPAEGVDMRIVNDQMIKFNNAIKLPSDYYPEASQHVLSAAAEQIPIIPRTDPNSVNSFSSTIELALSTSGDVPNVIVKIKEEITEDVTADFGQQNSPAALPENDSLFPPEKLWIKTEHVAAEENLTGNAYQRHVFTEDNKTTRDNDFFVDDSQQDSLRASSAFLGDSSTFRSEKIMIKTEDACIGTYNMAKKPIGQHIITEADMKDNGMSNCATDFSTYSEYEEKFSNEIACNNSNNQNTGDETKGCDTNLNEIAVPDSCYPESVPDIQNSPVIYPIIAPIGPSSPMSHIKNSTPESHIDEKLSSTSVKLEALSTVEECAPKMEYILVDCSAVVDNEAVKDSDSNVRNESPIEIVSSTSISSVECSKPHASNFSCKNSSARFQTSSELRKDLPPRSDKTFFSCNQCSALFKTSSDLKKHSLAHSNEKPFSCNRCSAQFKRSHDLKEHSLVHSNERPFSCNQCSAEFKRASALNRHLLTHSTERPFSCNQCSAQFKRACTLKRHSLTHSNERAFSCNECSAQFKTTSDLKKHSLAHSNEKAFSCNQCSAQFKRSHDLKKHSLAHSNKRVFSCNECSAQFVTNSDLKKHSLAHSNVKAFSCNQCSAEFKNTSRLNRHLLIHSTERAFSCNQCSAQFKRSYDLKKHSLAHSNERVFSCNECCAQFVTNSDLKRHSLAHSNERAFPCDECSAQFKTTSDLKKHSLAHSNEKSFSCNQCSAQFKRSYDLKKHSLAHSNEKTFSCNECSAQFVTNSDLKRHSLAHSNERAFSCNQCSAKFKSTSDLNRHLHIHSTERAFSCNQCSAQFKTASYLQRHSRAHSNERAFSCSQCSAQFKTISYLKKHLLAHSNERAFSCNQCPAQFKRSHDFKYHLLSHSNERAFSCNHCSILFKTKKYLKVHMRRKHHVG